MGRNREFKVEEVLDRAANVFWEKGYEATSMSDLTDEMGIQRASLYGAFGSKSELYAEALAQYQEEGRERLRDLLVASASPIEGLRSFLLTAIPTENCPRKGCLCINAAIEVAPHEAQIAELLRSHENLLIKLLAPVVASGQANGSIKLDVSPLEGATYISTCLYGLHVAAKTGIEPKALESRAEQMLSALTS